jgi:hypothetical protein
MSKQFRFWTEEDLLLLKRLVGELRPVPWVEIGKMMSRTGGACRKAYQLHYGEIRLRKPWTEEEDAFIKKKRAEGWYFRLIAQQMMGRSESEVNHRWRCLTHKLQSVTVEEPTNFELNLTDDQDDFEFSDNFWDKE